ncbi:NADP-dependent oxidoreductase domain-containing protein [Chaetomium strumarium]|uniref:NADP-dependent oxidoreductase domain-containing protein n=1 Tax=Chaetomium strumarium TaxID=1170767 RepID=A0AAJ0GWI5_9PEZI|nr:NADP-dependent oxidoreductase domain-containing protein [Chaetomium strumarium]
MSAAVKLATRPLGKNGPLVPSIGLGLMSLSSAHGMPKPDAERLVFLDKAYEIGETFWDTGALYVDLYYLYRLDKVTPVEKTMAALAKLKRIEYSAFSLDIEAPEHTLLLTYRELGIAVVAYSPLGKGMLGSAIRSVSDVSKPGNIRTAFAPRFSPQNLEANLALVNKLAEIASYKGLLAYGDDIFPIPGMRNPKRLAENLGAL